LEEVKLQCHQLRGRSKEEADQIVAEARAAGEEQLRQAEEQTRRVRREAEERLRALQSDTDAIWDARGKLLEELPRMAGELMDVTGAATARLQRPKRAGGPSPPPKQQRPSSASSEQTLPKRPPAPPHAERVRPQQDGPELVEVEQAMLDPPSERKGGSVSSGRS
jgi:hypothetical protein